MALVGWILLGILLFLLSLILLFLFFPIGYRITGKKDQNSYELHAKVKWLFGFVRVLFDLPEPGEPIAKVAFFTLMGPSKSKKEEKPATTGEPPQAGGQEQTQAVTNPESQRPDHEEFASNGNVQALNTELSSSPSGEQSSNTDGSDSRTGEQSSNTGGSGFRTGENGSATEDSPESSKSHKKKKEKAQKAKKDLSALLDDLKFYYELWNDGNTKPFVEEALGRIFRVIKKLLPRKIKGRILFGAATPDVTGYAFGAYSVLSSLFPRRICLEVIPDFENKILEGDVLIKGHFTIFMLLITGLRLFFDKRLKVLRKKLDHREKENEKN